LWGIVEKFIALRYLKMAKLASAVAQTSKQLFGTLKIINPDFS
jgi:hypothetical protein